MVLQLRVSAVGSGGLRCRHSTVCFEQLNACLLCRMNKNWKTDIPREKPTLCCLTPHLPHLCHNDKFAFCVCQGTTSQYSGVGAMEIITSALPANYRFPTTNTKAAAVKHLPVRS